MRNNPPVHHFVRALSLFVWGVSAVVLITPQAVAAATSAATSSSPEKGAAYYILRRVSVTTDAGINSIRVGTPVTILGRLKEGYKVALADGTQLTVTPQDITNDEGIVKQAVELEQATEAARANTDRAISDAEMKRQRDQAAAAEAAAREAQKMIPPTYTGSYSTGGGPSGLKGTLLDQKPESKTAVRPRETSTSGKRGKNGKK